MTPSTIDTSNRRKNSRINFANPVKFVSNKDRKAPLESAVGQNFSLNGLQVLCKKPMQIDDQYEMYVPTDNQNIIPLKGKVIWTELETSSKDSPYWLRAGLEISFQTQQDRTLFLSYLKDQLEDTLSAISV